VDSGGSRTCGIVLAGSYSWADSPLERLLPRPLLPVAHEPLISYVLRWLEADRVPHVAVCLNASSRLTRARLDGYAGLSLALDYHEDAVPRGPAGCARDAAMRMSSDAFVVADGTAIPRFELEGLLQAHRASGAVATVVVHEDHASDGGTRRSTPTGIYVFSPRAFDFVPERGFQDIKEFLIPRLYHEGERVLAYAVDAACPRVVNASTYLAVSQWMLARLIEQPVARAGYVAGGGVLVHRDARVASDARLVGPVLVGPDTHVMAGATIVGPTILGAGCTIEPRAVISRSVLWDRCVVGAEAIADACVVGDDATLERKVRLARIVRLPERRRADVRQPTDPRLAPAASLGLRPGTAVR
jgi:mannose-1-phosphate guanylyltransferase